MTKIRRIFSNFFILFLLMIFLNFCKAKLRSTPKSPHFFDFDEIKTDLFLKNNFNYSYLRQDEQQCSLELQEIKDGLMQSKQWAMKSKLKFLEYFSSFEAFG